MNHNSHIPLVDLKWQVGQIRATVSSEIDRIIGSAGFIFGDEVAAFETAFARYCQARECVGVGNGTDAIELALRAAGIELGDEVILPANTFVATVEGVVRAGGTPVLADCTEDHLIDPISTCSKLTSRTRAVIAVHLYGQMAPMDALRSALPDRVAIIEDAAQSHGAWQNGKRSGSVGLLAATSFYPGKNLGAFGDAGAVTTQDAGLAEIIKMLRNHGGIRRYEHSLLGTNSRLDTIQAVVLSAKLAKLDEWNTLRGEAATRYSDILEGLRGLELPTVARGNQHVWHLFVVRVRNRDRVLKSLNSMGVGAGIHYPSPIHLLPPFGQLGSKGSFPMAELLSREILSLPLYPGITEAQQARVADALADSIMLGRSEMNESIDVG